MIMIFYENLPADKIFCDIYVYGHRIPLCSNFSTKNMKQIRKGFWTLLAHIDQILDSEKKWFWDLKNIRI